MSRMLLVDDDASITEIMKRTLASAGHEVFVHNTGFGATVRALNVAPDIILLDVSMPGLNGDSLIRCMRAQPALARTPVVFYSAMGVEALAAITARAGATCFIQKGARPSEVAKRLCQIVDAAAPSPPILVTAAG